MGQNPCMGHVFFSLLFVFIVCLNRTGRRRGHPEPLCRGHAWIWRRIEQGAQVSPEQEDDTYSTCLKQHPIPYTDTYSHPTTTFNIDISVWIPFMFLHEPPASFLLSFVPSCCVLAWCSIEQKHEKKNCLKKGISLSLTHSHSFFFSESTI